MHELHISLLAAAIAAVIAFWLSMRCGKVRMAEKISMGDGGNDKMLRRMRAQANFTEYAPFALVLIVVLELAGQGGTALAISALAFMIGRVFHALGMDNDASKGRMIGMILTMPILLGWAIAAGLAAFGVI
jgi:uncharacterized membrane protein YecN with MAPEG domain